MQNSPTVEPRLLKAADAAKFLGISVSSLNSLRRRQIIPVVRVVSDFRYDLQDLLQLVEQSRVFDTVVQDAEGGSK